MKAATGETTLTLITIIALGAVLVFFWVFFEARKGETENIWKPQTEAKK